MAQKKTQKKSNELTFTHLIVTGLVMLVIGWVFGRLSLPVPGSVQAPATGQASGVQSGGFDFAALERATRDSPGSAAAWTALGNAYFDAGRNAEAVDAYTRSLEIDARNPNVWTDRGIMYRRLGNPSAAIADFDRAAQLDPTHLMSRFNKGIVLNYDVGNTEAALAAFDSVLAIDPNFETPAGAYLRDFMDSLR